LRIQSWARAQGLRLPRLTWVLGGEPISARKRQRLEEDGHRVYPWYGAIDTGRIAVGCLRPASSDDMHLLSDRFAAVLSGAEPGTAGAGRRLLLTSLTPELHRRMLNLDVGDLAAPLDRRCGCPFERLGLVRHLHAVHSREKLTVEGATLAADRVHELASDLLPAACGGSPIDYQIVEEEDGNGFTRLVVRVHPELAADEAEVRRTVESVLAAATGGATAERLRRAGVVTVRREKPRLTRGGKSLAIERDGRPVAGEAGGRAVEPGDHPVQVEPGGNPVAVEPVGRAVAGEPGGRLLAVERGGPPRP
jgi:phenylacetate-coenzyme A ligase PaaK-like adenylate-forming protein